MNQPFDLPTDIFVDAPFPLSDHVDADQVPPQGSELTSLHLHLLLQQYNSQDPVEPRNALLTLSFRITDTTSLSQTYVRKVRRKRLANAII